MARESTKKKSKKKRVKKSRSSREKEPNSNERAKNDLLKKLSRNPSDADEILESTDKAFKADREVVLTAVKLKGWSLEFASKNLRADREVVMQAVNQNGSALQYADKTLKADRGVVMKAVNKLGTLLLYADKTLKADREIVLAAVKQNGVALGHAAKNVKADHDVVLAAVKNRGDALEYADRTLKADREIVLAAVRGDGDALYHASKKLQEDEALREIAGWRIEATKKKIARKSVKGTPKKKGTRAIAGGGGFFGTAEALEFIGRHKASGDLIDFYSDDFKDIWVDHVKKLSPTKIEKLKGHLLILRLEQVDPADREIIEDLREDLVGLFPPLSEVLNAKNSIGLSNHNPDILFIDLNA